MCVYFYLKHYRKHSTLTDSNYFKQATYWKICMSLQLYTSTEKKKEKKVEGGIEVEESSTFPLKKLGILTGITLNT